MRTNAHGFNRVLQGPYERAAAAGRDQGDDNTRRGTQFGVNSGVCDAQEAD